jgi:hypothetical protein
MVKTGPPAGGPGCDVAGHQLSSADLTAEAQAARQFLALHGSTLAALGTPGRIRNRICS